MQSQLAQVRAQTGIRQPRPAPGQRNQLTSQSPAAVVESRPQVKISRAELAEQMLLYYMLHSQEVWAHVTATAGFHFVHERYQTLYLLAASYFTEHGDYSVADFLNYLNEDELRTTLSQIEQLRVNPAVQMPVIDDQINQVQKQLREANTLNNTELVMKLTVKLVDLLKEQQQYKAEETN